MAKDKQSNSVDGLVEAWKVNCAVSVALIKSIPAKGFKAVPAGSRGRTVAEQFEHMNRVRSGWVIYHRTGNRPSSDSVKLASLSRSSLAKAFTRSGKEVEQLIRDVNAGTASLRAFHKNPARFLGYLIAHDAHHRGSIMLALKQNAVRIPESVALKGMWQSWMW